MFSESEGEAVAVDRGSALNSPISARPVAIYLLNNSLTSARQHATTDYIINHSRVIDQAIEKPMKSIDREKREKNGGRKCQSVSAGTELKQMLQRCDWLVKLEKEAVTYEFVLEVPACFRISRFL